MAKMISVGDETHKNLLILKAENNLKSMELLIKKLVEFYKKRKNG